MGRVCVSPCRCYVLVSVVHSVVILSAVICVICSLLMFVSDASGDHMVVNRAPIAGGGEVRHNLHSSLSSL